MLPRVMLAAAALAALAVGPVLAQNFTRNPSFGTLNLNGNFMPDPQVVPAGGERHRGRQHPGRAAGRPLRRRHHRRRPGGAAEPPRGPRAAALHPRALNADTTLVIDLPNGCWICDDDFDGLNRGILFEQPISGRCDIWVGHYDRGRRVPAQPLISEIAPRR